MLDVMHIEKKNVCDAILGMLMNIPGKTKDVKPERDYFECKAILPEFWPHVMVSKNYVVVTRERAVRRR